MPRYLKEILRLIKLQQQNASDLGGERAYIADFEVYDQRSNDHSSIKT